MWVIRNYENFTVDGFAEHNWVFGYSRNHLESQSFLGRGQIKKVKVGLLGLGNRYRGVVRRGGFRSFQKIRRGYRRTPDPRHVLGRGPVFTRSRPAYRLW